MSTSGSGHPPPCPAPFNQPSSRGRMGYPEGFAQLQRPPHQPSCLPTTSHPLSPGSRCSLLSCIPSERSKKRWQGCPLSSSLYPLPSSFLSLFLQVFIKHLLCATTEVPAVNRIDKNRHSQGSSGSSQGGNQITMLRNRTQDNMKTIQREAGGGLMAAEKSKSREEDPGRRHPG